MSIITILYDNTVRYPNLESDWGFAALVESESGPTILFDTGASGRMLHSNMRNMGIAPHRIDEIFISHAHHDHVGGLSRVLDATEDVTVYVPPSFTPPSTDTDVITVRKPRRIHEGIYSTGELDGIEQSLAISTAKGILVVVGCSHPSMELILASAGEFGTPFGVLGGLHGTRPESLAHLDLIVATHCTRHRDEIRRRYPEASLPGGVGSVIQV